MSLMGSLIFAFNFSSLGCGLILKLMAHLWWRRLLWTIPHLGAAIFDVAGGLTHLCVQLLFVRLCGLGLHLECTEKPTLAQFIICNAVDVILALLHVVYVLPEADLLASALAFLLLR